MNVDAADTYMGHWKEAHLSPDYNANMNYKQIYFNPPIIYQSLLQLF